MMHALKYPARHLAFCLLPLLPSASGPVRILAASPGRRRRRHVAVAAEAGDHRQRDAHHRASGRRARRRAGAAQPRHGRARVAADAQSRRVRRQRARAAAVRRARADSHRGAARSPTGTTAWTAVLHLGRGLRLLEAPRRGVRQMGPRERAARRRPHHPHRAAAGASCRASRATSAMGTATTRPPG